MGQKISKGLKPPKTAAKTAAKKSTDVEPPVPRPRESIKAIIFVNIITQLYTKIQSIQK